MLSSPNSVFGIFTHASGPEIAIGYSVKGKVLRFENHLKMFKLTHVGFTLLVETYSVYRKVISVFEDPKQLPMWNILFIFCSN